MKTLHVLSVAAVLGLVACAVQEDDSETSSNAIVGEPNADGSLHVADIGKESTLKLVVDGKQRADAKVLPIGLGDACSGMLGKKDSIETNFTYVELTNTADVTRSVDLSIKGEDLANVHLIAYAAAKAPHTAAEANECLAIAHGTAIVKDDTRPVEGGPKLASTTATGVVVAPKSSVYVLVATEEGKGDYSLTAKTIAKSDSAPDTGEVILPPTGTMTSTAVMVSGVARAAAKLLPVGIGDKCGGSRGDLAAPATNYAYLEFKNTSAKTLSFDARISGGNLAQAHLFAYESATAPKDEADADKCLTVAHGTVAKGESGLGVVAGTLRLSDGGKAINVPAKSSVYVLVATEGGTGAYKMDVRSDEEAKDTDVSPKPPVKTDAGATPESDAGGDAGEPPADDWAPTTDPQSNDDFGNGDYYGGDGDYDYGYGEEQEIDLPSKKPKSGACSATPRTASSPLAALAGAFAFVGLVRRRRERRSH